MHDPTEANKSYLTLFIDRGSQAALQALTLIVMWVISNYLLGIQFVSTSLMIFCYFLFLCYFTWQPKLIRFLRGILRGKEWRDKVD